MNRTAFQQLTAWKQQTKRKPLIIRGARQTGKTWLIREFGRQAFAEFIYINFENEPRFRNLFQQDYNVQRILETIQLFHGKKIDADNTLIIFDEIQAAEGGVTALKTHHSILSSPRVLCWACSCTRIFLFPWARCLFWI